MIIIKTTKRICMLGLGIALYVVLGTSLNIPMIGHIQTDLGYIVFGLYLMIFGWQGCVVGIIGCLFESLLVSGWLPVGWMLGQAVIGVICGITYTKTKNMNNKIKYLVNTIVTIIAVFIGIGLVKTIVECQLYSIPFSVKFIKDCVATVADVIPMIFGMLIGCKLKNYKLVEVTDENKNYKYIQTF